MNVCVEKEVFEHVWKIQTKQILYRHFFNINHMKTIKLKGHAGEWRFDESITRILGQFLIEIMQKYLEN